MHVQNVTVKVYEYEKMHFVATTSVLYNWMRNKSAFWSVLGSIHGFTKKGEHEMRPSQLHNVFK